MAQRISKSLLGWLSLGTGVYCAAFFPDNWLLPYKLVIGFMAVMVSGWCYVSLFPARIIGLAEDARGAQAVTTLTLIALLQLLHPTWLYGDWLGWVSPFFPGFLLISFVASVLRIFKSW